ncbi:hypothetical protein CB0940_04720 [Cercospora beticola]|uniref:SET domain-containing protein n=1 Tax=Cercospora beticola TaxID=122368 RepID=A0A2G5HK06_CERBT|nr:hypothetical protein CB0940_04720 [Cercospora beticola]PIA92860.1 hypothetical protein CB0940_04720 [Cercospora beticola]WPB01983.1 hypothetical protein RHO25_006617 [Cercospora beticola]CAK1363168.1 unnamed protein product [Cercospora beticola]
MAQAGPSEGNHGFYEIKDAGRKGQGAFALKDICAGTRILVDAPLFVIDKNSQDDIELADILSKLSALPSATRHQFGSLPFAPFFANGSSMMQLYSRFDFNKFAISGGKGWGCFRYASRFNNSCLPNCAISTTNQGTKQLRVTRNVSAGDELTFAYFEGLQYMTTAERQEFLHHQFSDSPCICQLCSLPADQRMLSDMRRKLMRHLLYVLRNGMDLEAGIPPQITSRNYHPLPEFEIASEPAGYFTALAEAEGIVGVLVWNMYVKGGGDLLQDFHSNGFTRVPRSAMRTIGLWMRRASHIKMVLLGSTGFSRKQIDDQADRLVEVADMLEQSGGRFDAAGL